MLPPKTFHHAKFHRDRSNQLGEKRYKNWASDKKYYFVTDGQKRDYLSRASQRARGTTNNVIAASVRNKISLMPTISHFSCRVSGVSWLSSDVD